ncbi:MAG: ATP-dependent DNA ligase [Gemmataceae bacterium]
MKAFAQLYAALDSTTKTNAKLAALVDYFRGVDPAEGAWAVYFLSGRKLRQAVPSRKLAQWAAEAAGIERWLFEECYHAVGDIAETIALLLPDPTASDDAPLSEWVSRLEALRDALDQKTHLQHAWASLDRLGRFIWNKLITGGFRVGVSQLLLTRALAEVAHLEPSTIAHRLMGDWFPSPAFFLNLLSANHAADASRPYPFFLASPLERLDDLGPRDAWLAEWKWDGIRAQLVRRSDLFLWSRGEELVTQRFPELAEAGRLLPTGTVLDGEILPWREQTVLPFSVLQRRIGRKTLSKKILAEVPVVLLAYDLLEEGGIDLRDRPLWQRRAQLERLLQQCNQPRLQLSPVVQAASWEELAAQRDTARQRQVEGLMLKRLDSPYRVGRVKGDWWKWKIHPLTLDAVLVYAQRGSGKRASLYTDYTFALRDGNELVPFAKAYSGLNDEELAQVDAFIKRNTLEKFGPVRSVKPQLVFELAFEGIQRSDRHKSGIAVRFPRILRPRPDKTPADIDTLQSAQRLLPPEPKSLPSEFTQGELFG